MQNPKLDGTTWTSDTRADQINTYTETYTPEGGTEQTAEYKLIETHPIIGGVLDKLAFLRTHASAVWYNKLAGITVLQKLDNLASNIGTLASLLTTDKTSLVAAVNELNGKIGKVDWLAWTPGSGINSVVRAELSSDMHGLSILQGSLLPRELSTVTINSIIYHVLFSKVGADDFYDLNDKQIIEVGKIILNIKGNADGSYNEMGIAPVYYYRDESTIYILVLISNFTIPSYQGYCPFVITILK